MDLNNEQVIALLREIGQGNESAMQTLYTAYSRRVFAFAHNRLKDHGAAEEIVVDTMHAVWRHPQRFRGEAKFSTWLLGIARYKALSLMRQRQQTTEPIEDYEDELPSEDAGALETLARNQQQAGVQNCLSKLSEEHRECLHLVYYEGYSLAEVARVQACPENTVKTRLFHARQKIKHCMQRMMEQELAHG